MTVIRFEAYVKRPDCHMAISTQGDVLHFEHIDADTNPVMVGIETGEDFALTNPQIDTLNQLIEFLRQKKPCAISFGAGLEYLSPVFPVTNLIARSVCTLCQREVATYYSRETGKEVAQVVGV